MRRRLKNNRGMALILTLLIVSLVTALSLQLNASTRSEYYAAVNLKDSVRLESIAKSGFYCFLGILKNDDPDYDCLMDDWKFIEDPPPALSIPILGCDSDRLPPSSVAARRLVRSLLNLARKISVPPANESW